MRPERNDEDRFPGRSPRRTARPRSPRPVGGRKEAARRCHLGGQPAIPIRAVSRLAVTSMPASSASSRPPERFRHRCRRGPPMAPAAISRAGQAHGHDAPQDSRRRHCSHSPRIGRATGTTRHAPCVSVAADEEGRVGPGCPHRRHVPETSAPNLGFELLRRVCHEDDLIGLHVDRDVLARVPLEVPVAGHGSMMPALRQRRAGGSWATNGPQRVAHGGQWRFMEGREKGR